MAVELPHRCDEACICPIHETPMWYATDIKEHACQDVDCKYGHGFESVKLEECRNWEKA